MPIKHQDFIIQGMFRDTSEHAFDSKFAYENQNLRITAEPNSDSGHTGDMYALTNEKGNKYVPIYGLDSTGHNATSFEVKGDMWGVPIGQALLNEQWVVFMIDRGKEIFLDSVEREIEDFSIEETQVNNLIVDSLDRIYKLWFNEDKLFGDLLYEGHLNFSISNPIETIVFYENEDIQKVYWTDGLNQPRFINIVESKEKRNKWNDTSFDFVSTLQLEENCKIERQTGNGEFPAGVIQYYFTYSNLFGVETNVFYTSQLYPIAENDRGLSPDDKIALTFKIELSNLDTNYNYINIYSVIRTSLNNVPICKRIIRSPYSDTFTYYDINQGETIEPQSLFYKGGSPISAYTFEQKNNTLFLGNYSLKQNYIPSELRTKLREYCTNLKRSDSAFNRSMISDTSTSNLKWETLVYWLYNDGEPIKDDYISSYNLFNSIIEGKTLFNQSNFTCNYYRLGLQFQHYTGKWSEVVWIGDYKSGDIADLAHYSYLDNKGIFHLHIDNSLKSTLQSIIDLGYRKVRPVVCYPKQSDKVFICEGILQSTVFLCQAESINKFYPDAMIRFQLTSGSNKKVVPRYVNNSYEKHANTYEEIPFTFFQDPISTGTTQNSCKVLPNDIRCNLSRTVLSLFSYDALDVNSDLYNMDYSNCYIRKYNTLSPLTVDFKKELYIKELTHVKNGYYNSKGNYVPSSNYGDGLLKPPFTTSGSSGHIGTGWVYQDYFANPATVHNDTLDKEVPTGAVCSLDENYYIMYPIDVWQHSGSINFDTTNKTSVLKSNKTLQTFNTTGKNYSTSTDFTPKNIQPWYSGIIGEDIKNTALLYDGNVSLLQSHSYIRPQIYYCTPNDFPDGNFTLGYYDELYSLSNLEYDDASTSEEKQNELYSNGNEKMSFTQDIKYKTPPHLVVFGNKYQSIDDSSNSIKNEYIDDLYNHYSYRSAVLQNVNDSIYNNRPTDVNTSDSYCIAGLAVSICNKSYDSTENKYEYTAKDNIDVYYLNGDIYYYSDETYLRTFAYSQEDENNYIEGWYLNTYNYLHPLCRYDRNRKNINFSSNMSNFWLQNRVYNQKDNFMTYHELDLSQNSVNNFPNSFTWTLTKYAGDEIDKWTQLTLANTYDVDGDKGQITKLINYQDILLYFQPKQFGQVLYNEREQLVTGSGVPVELSNSGKVNGVRPVSVLAGCNNKWSICKSEKALYWVDDVNKQILNYSGQLNNMSNTLGFHSWINDKANLFIWNPIEFNNFVSYFDPYNEDVVFHYKENALSFSEQLQCFDTFLPYEYVPYYMPFHNSAFTLSDRDSDGKDTYKVWEHFKGHYNYFYVHDDCTYENNKVFLKGRYDNNGKPTNYGYRPYWTTLLVNPDMPYDKVFNNTDIRTDMWNEKGELLEETFSHLEVWNEFQWNKSLLIRQIDVPKIHYPDQHSILKKKFRVWYTNIPRDIKQYNPRLRYYNRDRMRNTWLYLKYSKELVYNDSKIEYPYISDNKHIIHHIGVSYFI